MYLRKLIDITFKPKSIPTVVYFGLFRIYSVLPRGHCLHRGHSWKHRAGELVTRDRLHQPFHSPDGHQQKLCKGEHCHLWQCGECAVCPSCLRQCWESAQCDRENRRAQSTEELRGRHQEGAIRRVPGPVWRQTKRSQYVRSHDGRDGRC